MLEENGSAEMSGSNVVSEIIAEALVAYTADKGAHDRTGMQIARNQAKYGRLGVSAEMIRLLHKESRLTEEERQQKYANELRYRKAVSLWDAESEDDFAMAMEAASQTQAAHGHVTDLLAAARSYNDGFNSAAHGRADEAANPHTAGTLQHAQWAKGCKDGIKHLKEFGEEPTAEGEKRGRGRPRKVVVTEPTPEQEEEAQAGAEPAGGGFGFPSIPH
jgi:hypothetical protein